MIYKAPKSQKESGRIRTCNSVLNSVCCSKMLSQLLLWCFIMNSIILLF